MLSAMIACRCTYTNFFAVAFHFHQNNVNFTLFFFFFDDIGWYLVPTYVRFFMHQVFFIEISNTFQRKNLVKHNRRNLNSDATMRNRVLLVWLKSVFSLKKAKKKTTYKRKIFMVLYSSNWDLMLPSFILKLS